MAMSLADTRRLITPRQESGSITSSLLMVQISTERKVFKDQRTKEFLPENGSQNVTAGPVVQDVHY